MVLASQHQKLENVMRSHKFDLKPFCVHYRVILANH